jgi:hypothetical protein
MAAKYLGTTLFIRVILPIKNSENINTIALITNPKINKLLGKKLENTIDITKKITKLTR